MSRKMKERLMTGTIFVILTVSVLLMLLPLISMLGTALKNERAALASTSLFPGWGEWSLMPFVDVFRRTDFARNLWNSTVIAATTTVLCILVSSLAGYSLSRFRGRFFSGFTVGLLMLQMFPEMLTLIPMFLLFSRANLVNTLAAPIINYTIRNLAFSIMMINGFFDTIPQELEQAAMVDGCTRFKAYLRVILPISLPGIATVAIFTFLNAWNEFTFASLVLRRPEMQTLTIGLTKFVQQYTANWALLMAASTIATLPAFVFLLFTQKYLIQGLTSGAVKG